jgi:hypothetical protein
MVDHMDMIAFLTGLAALGAIGALAARYGAEQREGFDERPLPREHRPNL